MSFRNQGSNWIRAKKRLAVYLRDDLACVYCGHGLEEGADLTLDHFIARENGGNNSGANLVTACRECNDSKADASARVFLGDVGELGRIRERLSLPLPLDAARSLLERRGTVRAVLLAA